MNSALRNLNWLSCPSTTCEKKVTEQTIEQVITISQHKIFSRQRNAQFHTDDNMYVKKKKIPLHCWSVVPEVKENS